VPIETHFDKRFETPYFSGTGCAFRKASLLEAGLYPEILYMHYEEYELAYRLLDTGKTLVYCPDITVLHHEHQVSRRSEIKTFYKHRNQILVAVALYPFWRGIAYVLPRTVKTFFDALRHGYLKSYFKSLKSARELASIRLQNRKPIAKQTWQRIASMKRGLLVL
jgi:GT2 family glycosyltransferase